MNIPFLDRLPAKQVVRIVAITLILLFALAYQYAFRGTWQLYQAQSTNPYADLDPVELSTQVRNYETRLANLDASIGSADYQRNILFKRCGEIAAEFNLELLEFSVEQSYPSPSGVERIINQIQLRGNYEDIVRFAYVLEEEDKLSQVISSTFSKRKNIRTKKTFLSAVLTLENFRLNS